MNTIMVVSNPKRWPLRIPGVEIVAARDYLADPRFSMMTNLRVCNLCRSYGYQTAGYYVSLLAEARGHKPLPTVTTLRDLQLPPIRRLAEQTLGDLIKRSLRGVKNDEFELWVSFGSSYYEKHRPLARALFNIFPAPLLRVTFVNDGGWEISSVRVVGAAEIPDPETAYIAEQAERYFARGLRKSRAKSPSRYDMAILHKPDDPMPCSDKAALRKFALAGEAMGIRCELITKDDAGKVAEYDALFIRDTTAVNHYTYRMSRRAAAEGMVVIDDPVSIVRCTNKVYQAEMMSHHRIPTPATVIFGEDTAGLVAERIGFPAVIKQPDSSFSAGVIKIDTEQEFRDRLDSLLDTSELLIAQEFVPTEFDWRIGVLGGQALFASKYYMARAHWQILNRTGSKVSNGKFETLPIEQVPPAVVRLGVRAARQIGDGLYGVDIKVIGGRPKVIEINDNPNIDVGVEDKAIGDTLYERVMAHFISRLEGRRRG